jgi:hypothetical protein
MRRQNRAKRDLSFWGADAFFSAMDVMKRAVAVLRTGTEAVPDSRTHPPSTLRRSRPRAWFGGLESMPDDVKAGLELSELAEFITETLWARSRERLIALHESGVRPVAVRAG